MNYSDALVCNIQIDSDKSMQCTGKAADGTAVQLCSKTNLHLKSECPSLTQQ